MRLLHPFSLLVLILLVLIAPPAPARDDGRYAQSPFKQWFDGLTSRHGSRCCSDADGQRLDDPEWEQTAAGYRVRIKGQWHRVPDSAIVDGTNKVGYALVWPITWYDGMVEIRCFMPGSGV